MKKYRHELKFIINKNMASILKQRLSLVMTLDANSLDGAYLIRSLYFDDVKKTAYYDKLDGLLFRKKYRIRIYNNSCDVIKLECKHKDDTLTFKRNTLISYDVCQALINGNEIISNNKLVNELNLMIKFNGLRPTVIVDYKRVAYTYPVSDVRVTFDSQISSGYNNYDIFDKNATSVSTIDDGEVVLEVKFNEIMPSHIALILQSVPLLRQAFSKFTVCQSMKE
ncbi:MAG: polyphosphate polymerase domain-containing protein [Bacilli bacterium]